MELRQAVRERQVILFVGAGVSMNLGLPSWEDLMRKMGEDLGFPPDEFIRQRIGRAALIAAGFQDQDLHDISHFLISRAA